MRIAHLLHVELGSNSRTGYAAPENLQHYALYLDARIRAYRDLKHDAIKVQSDTNRDMRSSMAFDEEGASSSAKGSKRGRRGRDDPAPASAPTRSKTIMGRKLRVMTVEKGLLRETKIVHGMIDALVECRVSLGETAACMDTIANAGSSSILTIWRTC